MTMPPLVYQVPEGYRRFRYAKVPRGSRRARSWEEATRAMQDKYGPDIKRMKGDDRYYVFCVPEGE